MVFQWHLNVQLDAIVVNLYQSAHTVLLTTTFLAVFATSWNVLKDISRCQALVFVRLVPLTAWPAIQLVCVSVVTPSTIFACYRFKPEDAYLFPVTTNPQTQDCFPKLDLLKKTIKSFVFYRMSDTVGLSNAQVTASCATPCLFALSALQPITCVLTTAAIKLVILDMLPTPSLAPAWNVPMIVSTADLTASALNVMLWETPEHLVYRLTDASLL